MRARLGTTWCLPGRILRRNIDGSAATDLAHVEIRSGSATIATVNVNAPGKPQSYNISYGVRISGQRPSRRCRDVYEGRSLQPSNVAAITPSMYPEQSFSFHAVVDQRRIMLTWSKPLEHPELADVYVVTRTDMPAEARNGADTHYEDSRYPNGQSSRHTR